MGHIHTYRRGQAEFHRLLGRCAQQAVMIGALCLLVILGGWQVSLQAAVSPERQRNIDVVRSLIDDAAKSFKAKEYAEARVQLGQARKIYDRLILHADQETLDALKPQYERLKRAQALLKSQGLPLEPLPDFPSAPLPSATAPETPATEETDESKEVSFALDIAPVLVRQCGRCHIDKSEGELSMSNYSALLQGGENGPPIVANDAKGSKLLELVRTKKMPPRRGLPPKDVQRIERWINDGAKFDGDSDTTDLGKLTKAEVEETPTEDAAETASPEAAAPAAAEPKEEMISFVRQVAPIFIKQCGSCHIDDTKGEFSMATFTDLMSGGKQGSVIQAGDADQSSLYTLVSTKKMPPKKGLSDEDADVIKRWIAQGALFDGPDETAELSRIATVPESQ